MIKYISLVVNRSLVTFLNLLIMHSEGKAKTLTRLVRGVERLSFDSPPRYTMYIEARTLIGMSSDQSSKRGPA
jgi:hypothetical protein